MSLIWLDSTASKSDRLPTDDDDESRPPQLATDQQATRAKDHPVHLNDLLKTRGIDPKTVLVFRHRPPEPALRSALPWLAAEQPDVFNAYQRVHGPKVEAALQKAEYVASFIGHDAGKALFIGLYRRGDARPVDRDTCYAAPEFKALIDLGWQDQPETFLLFDLASTGMMTEWSGRLVVDWPPPDRSWWRWADRNAIAVRAIHESNVLCADMPSWDRLVLSWNELSVLPQRWRAALAEWCGIYLIFDTRDAKAYVGSAYGTANILGRWRTYATNGHGDNVELKGRDPTTLRFSILQRVSPDMEAADVIALESNWKERLHTREFGLNAN